MYLNSLKNPTEWICIVRSREKQVKKVFQALKRTDKDVNVLKIDVYFDIFNATFWNAAIKNYLEITYTGVSFLINALHLTVYQKT